MKYQTIYSFEVLNEIENGQRVYMLDRKCAVTANVSNLTVEELVEIIKQEKEESTRFQFWTEKAEKED